MTALLMNDLSVSLPCCGVVTVNMRGGKALNMKGCRNQKKKKAINL